jgi:hypothetical protein
MYLEKVWRTYGRQQQTLEEGTENMPRWNRKEPKIYPWNV